MTEMEKVLKYAEEEYGIKGITIGKEPQGGDDAFVIGLAVPRYDLAQFVSLVGQSANDVVISSGKGTGGMTLYVQADLIPDYEEDEDEEDEEEEEGEHGDV